jgi:hypothetical protein
MSGKLWEKCLHVSPAAMTGKQALLNNRYRVRGGFVDIWSEALL